MVYLNISGKDSLIDGIKYIQVALRQASALVAFFSFKQGNVLELLQSKLTTIQDSLLVHVPFKLNNEKVYQTVSANNAEFKGISANMATKTTTKTNTTELPSMLCIRRLLKVFL